MEFISLYLKPIIFAYSCGHKFAYQMFTFSLSKNVFGLLQLAGSETRKCGKCKYEGPPEGECPTNTLEGLSFG